MLSTLQVVTTVTVGLMVGVEFSVAVIMSRILDALPGDSRQQGHAHGGRLLGALMPFWYGGSLVLSAVWAVAAWDRPGPPLGVVAPGLLLLRVLMPVLLLVPLNHRHKNWTPEKPPADRAGQRGRGG